ncbi:putative metal-dependent hydrolase [Actinomadura rubteroloni]|uniref:Putative metal-dependent hydrolase n=1 Tax=Actinomadura rubteroloni TaxID=1926885 RepID=A0A2P4UB89_9ACTN|nr:metal-dependent hydrolase [Actinomadura rubteroloni]POM22284.1 putative metal-dependent hydrolase [Actinomadura rubteroloni]
MTRSTPESPASAIDERHPPIRPRRVSFDWTKTPLHWIPGDPVATHIINSFHIVLPEGEKWFIQCVKDARPYIKDEQLLEEIKGFIGQEMVHARSHQGVLDQILSANGIDVSKITEAAAKGNADRPAQMAALKKKNPRAWRRRLRFELAAVASIEHYTAVLGQWLMEDDRLDKAGIDPTMLDLLRWHGAEEVEHRSVVFDVFQALGGRYPTRVLAWVVSLFFLYWALIGGSLYLLKQDPTVKRVSLPRVLIAYRRSVRRGHVPGIFKLLLGEAPIYLKPSHHPSQICSTPKALEYIHRSPAARSAGYDPY